MRHLFENKNAICTNYYYFNTLKIKPSILLSFYFGPLPKKIRQLGKNFLVSLMRVDCRRYIEGHILCKKQTGLGPKVYPFKHYKNARNAAKLQETNIIAKLQKFKNQTRGREYLLNAGDGKKLRLR